MKMYYKMKRIPVNEEKKSPPVPFLSLGLDHLLKITEFTGNKFERARTLARLKQTSPILNKTVPREHALLTNAKDFISTLLYILNSNECASPDSMNLFIIQTLGKLGCARHAIEHLSKDIDQNPDQRYIAEVLVKLHDPKQIKILERFFHTHLDTAKEVNYNPVLPEDYSQESLVSEMSFIAITLVENGSKKDDLINYLIYLVDHGSTHSTSALKALLSLNDPVINKKISKTTTWKSNQTLIHQSLLQKNNEEAIRYFICQMLNSQINDYHRQGYVVALRNHKYSSIEPYLKNLLKNTETPPSVSFEAAISLTMHNNPKGKEKCVEILTNEEQPTKERKSAADALKKSKDPLSINQIEATFQETTDIELKIHLAFLLAHPIAVQYLVTTIADDEEPNNSNKRCAIEYLGKLGEFIELQKLRENNKMPYVTEMALAKLGEREGVTFLITSLLGKQRDIYGNPAGINLDHLRDMVLIFSAAG